MRKLFPTTARGPQLTQIAALMASSSFAALLSMPAFGQTAPAADAQADVGGLERVVVTATSTLRSKLRSSVSVTDVDQQRILDFAPRSEAEVLHLIPGVRAESSAGPGGNSNISVRGLPLADGGAKYVQLQEDGLPTVAFGDMNFANSDYWMRYDYSIDRIQTVRGGSSSTAASHAPGAIINFISKTGDVEGGSVGLTRGLDFHENRLDGSYGGKLAPNLRFHIGGYFRDGEGPRDTGTNSLHGYQLKGNLTKTFNGGKGFFRVNFKALDEHAPTYTSMPVYGTKNGDTVGNFRALPNYNILKDSQYSPFVASMATVGPVGTAVGSSSLHEGITVHAKALGFEFENDVGNGITLNNKYRYNKQGGAFQTTFAGYNTLTDVLGGFAAGAEARYANGPKKGQVVTTANLQNGLLSNGPGINVQTPNMNHWVNDFSVAKKFGDVSARGGVYLSSQSVHQVWQITPLLTEVGRTGAVVDVFAGSGAAAAALTTMGMSGFNNNWGDCCARKTDATFATTAPYVALSMEYGNFDFDAGLRRDSVKASGTVAFGTAADRRVDVNGDGAITGAESKVMLVDILNARPLAYTVNANSYSLGGNYRLNKDLSFFLRASKGARITADRVNLGAVDASGKILPGGNLSFLGEVNQTEAGVKTRGDFAGAKYSVFATIFESRTTEYSYDQTRIQLGLDPIQFGKFKAKGLELETVLAIGSFAVNTNLTVVDMKNAAGFTPHANSKLMYTVAPRYNFGPVTLGAVFVGRSKSPNGDTPADGYTEARVITNAFASVDLSDNAVISLNASNVFNKIASSGQVSTTSTPGLYNFRPETGRAVSASLRYNF